MAQLCASLQGLCWAAREGRMSLPGPSRVSVPSQRPSVSPCGQLGCKGQEPWGSCHSPSLQRQQGLSLTPACKAHLSLVLLHKGSCRSGVPGPRTARVPAPLCPLPSRHTLHHGAAAPSATASLGRVLLMRRTEKSLQPGISHSSVHHTERRVQPKMPIWVQKHDAQPPCRWCHLMVQKQNHLPSYSSPGLFVLL